MATAYFDTTVYDDVEKGWIPAARVDAVRGARAEGEILAYPSVSCKAS